LEVAGRRQLSQNSSVAREGLLRVRARIQWRLEAKSHELAFVLRERDVVKKALAAIEQELEELSEDGDDQLIESE
jgi:hypothetical protein